VFANGYDFKITDVTLSNSAIADSFRTQYRPLKTDELKGPEYHGYLVTVDILPNLPMGRFKQDVLITTDGPKREEPLGHHIDGQVVGDISIGGAKGWITELDLLSLGRVEQRTGAHARLYLLLRGPQRDKLQITLASSVPEGIRAVAGQTTPVGKGDIWRMPIDITVPPGMKPINLLPTTNDTTEVLGKLVFQTNHPDEKEFTVRERKPALRSAYPCREQMVKIRCLEPLEFGLQAVLQTR
jgi:hypothetical protein